MEEQQIIDLFRKHDLKVTTQRLLVSKYILSRKDHPSADQIYSALKEDYPTISLATVYKTLNILKEIGVVQELGFGEGAIRYDPNSQLHVNMICRNCEKISDFQPDDIENWWNILISKLDLKPLGQRIDIYYKCDECSS